MEFCSLDWGAIAGFAGVGATVIAARVAWNISEEWKNQKGSEVIACLLYTSPSPRDRG